MNSRFIIVFCVAIFLIQGKGGDAQTSGHVEYAVYKTPERAEPTYKATLDFSQGQSIFRGEAYKGIRVAEYHKETGVDEKGQRYIDGTLRTRSGDVYVVSDARQERVESYEVMVRGEELYEYVTQEPMREIGWEPLDTTTSVDGREAKGAKGWFRGREYFAWYLPSVPVAFGPWKFNGLPGLIVWVEEIGGVYAFLAEKIEVSTSYRMPKVQFTPTSSKISIEQYAFYRDHWKEDALSIAKARAKRGHMVYQKHASRIGDEAFLEKNFQDLLGDKEQ